MELTEGRARHGGGGWGTKREREVSIGDAVCVERDEESRRTFDHHPLIGTFSFPYSSFAFSSLFCLALSAVHCFPTSLRQRERKNKEA